MFASPAGPGYTPRAAAGRSVPLQTARTVPFTAAGVASIVVGPDRAGQRWHVTRLVTSVAPAGNGTELYVYRNAAMPSDLIDSTLNADQATSETDFTLLEGERLVCVWSGGPAGATATIVISGEVLL